jgi:hypothetical protein
MSPLEYDQPPLIRGIWTISTFVNRFRTLDGLGWSWPTTLDPNRTAGGVTNAGSPSPGPRRRLWRQKAQIGKLRRKPKATYALYRIGSCRAFPLLLRCHWRRTPFAFTNKTESCGDRRFPGYDQVQLRVRRPTPTGSSEDSQRAPSNPRQTPADRNHATPPHNTLRNA